MQVEIEIPEPYIELFQPTKKWRHLCYHGGRSSAKSTDAAIALDIIGTSTPKRMLCCREVQNSIADSVHKLLANMIQKYNLPGWDIGREYIRNRNGMNVIMISVPS